MPALVTRKNMTLDFAPIGAGRNDYIILQYLPMPNGSFTLVVPSFETEDQVAGIKANEEEPGYAAMVAFAKQVFDGGPYGHPAEGLADSVGKLTSADVSNFYRQYYRMGSATVAVAGDDNHRHLDPKLS